MCTSLIRKALWTIAVLSFVGCHDAGPVAVEPGDPSLHRGDAGRHAAPTSVIWNERAAALLGERLVTSNSIGSRVLAYLSLAQYRAARAVDRAGGRTRPHMAAAVGAASVVVLGSFFPADASALEARLAEDLAGASEQRRRGPDVAAGGELGRKIAAEVLELAASDGNATMSPGLPPIGPEYWVSSGAPIARSLYRTRPFFIPVESDLGIPNPPTVGSPEFLENLAEVREFSDTRTEEQAEIARKWARQPPPGIAQLNLVADELIRSSRRYHSDRERAAARLLFVANAAVFDAQVACFEGKFKYWYLRPVHADPAITLVVGLPNHPSYPSAHSCITSAFMGVLSKAFPRERRMLSAQVEEAGMSRLYAGLHYRFDMDAGQLIGARAAKYALNARLH